MAKDGKKKKDGKKGKPDKKAKSTAAGKSTIVRVAKKLKSATDNPLVAEIVAAALVATAAALKDSKKAHRLAEEAGDELTALTKTGATNGNAMWQLALDIARRTMAEMSDTGRTPRR